MKYFTIHLGSPAETGRFDEAERLSAMHKVMRHFEVFTISEGRGFLRGRFEDVLLIRVATEEVRSVAELVEDLRRTFNLEGIGIEHAGRYLRATKETNSDDLEADLLRDLRSVRRV